MSYPYAISVNGLRRAAMIFVVASFLFLPTMALADETTPSDGGDIPTVGLEEAVEAAGEESGIGQTGGLSELVGNIVNAVLGMVGVIFFVLMIYAGFLWMMAQGNEEQVTKAKNIFATSVIGLIVILGAYYIIDFVIGAIYRSLGAQ